jgi:hypothetical protein
MIKGMGVSLVVIASVAVTFFVVSDALAQQKHQLSFKTLAENTTVIQQHVIDVGDVPGHQVRIFEGRATFPKDPPIFEGVRTKERWVRGLSDYIDLNGRAATYLLLVLETGDKIFARGDGVSQSTVNPDGSRKATGTLVYTITGGTGKFLGIRGVIRETTSFDPKAGLVDVHSEGEYWLDK